MDQGLQDQVDNVKKTMTARKVTKFVVSAIVGHCAAVTAKNIIRHVHPETDSKAEEAKLALGTYAIGGAVALKARRVIDHDIDDLFDILAGVQKAFKTPVTPTPVTETIVVPPSE